MANYTLSIGVPLGVGVKDDGYVVVCHQIPMILGGRDLDAMGDHVKRALALAGDYLLSLGTETSSAYLKSRSVDHTFEGPRHSVDAPRENGMFRYGGGALVHASA